MKKNVGSQVIGVQMVSATDGSAFTGTATVVITGDGGTQSASGGTGPTHEGNGFHTYIPTQAETNYDHIGFTFTGSGAVPVTVQVYTSFPQTGDSYTRIGAPAGASLAADIATVDTNVDAILVDTNELQGDWTDGGRLDLIIDAILTDTGTTLSAQLTTIDNNVDSILADTGTDGVVISGTVANQIADALLNRDMSAVSDTNARSPLNALRILRNKYSVSGTTLTVTKEDDVTSAWTSTLTTDATADPVTGSDPA